MVSDPGPGPLRKGRVAAPSPDAVRGGAHASTEPADGGFNLPPPEAGAAVDAALGGSDREPAPREPQAPTRRVPLENLVQRVTREAVEQAQLAESGRAPPGAHTDGALPGAQTASASPSARNAGAPRAPQHPRAAASRRYGPPPRRQGPPPRPAPPRRVPSPWPGPLSPRFNKFATEAYIKALASTA